ncbi:MAG: gephyrin-like molybdotransferase Glp [Candidatus Bipolaricaulia bacterium]
MAVSRGFKRLERADEALERFLKRITPLERTEVVALEEADRRVLTKWIVSERDVPHYDRSAMDGYAIRAEDTFGASRISPAVMQLVEGPIGPNECSRVNTGAPIPQGADAVLMLEYTEQMGDEVEVFKRVARSENIGRRGEDIERGAVVFEAGHRLRPADLGLLRAVGVEQVDVYEKPTVAVLTTGEELIGPAEEPKPGQMIDTNGLTISLYVKRWGGQPRYRQAFTDKPSELEAILKENLDADLLVFTGGSSVGSRDQIVEAVERRGEVLTHGVAIQPAKPVVLAVAANRPAICLPGYPAATVIAALQFLKPAVDRLARIPPAPPRTVRASLERKITSELGLKSFTRVRLEGNVAHPVRTSGAGILSSIAQNHGLVITPENSEGREAGEEVEVLLLE